MSQRAEAQDPRPEDIPVSPELDALTEPIIRRLQAGEPIRAEEYIARYPAWADSIRRLFPAVHDLVRLGQSVAGRRKEIDLNDARSQMPEV